MHYRKRPSPFTYAAAGGIFSIGVVSLLARAIDTFTSFNLAPPFDLIAFTLSVIGIIGGGAFITWLVVRTYRHTIAALRAENAELRADRDRLDTLIQAVRDADAQGERNYVRIGKAIKMIEDWRDQQTGDGDTVRIARLHSINGKGSA